MKHLKQKLMASLAMLLVASTMMGTSTYAWFAISTAPEVTGVVTSIEPNEAFEIATGTTQPDAYNTSNDTGNNATWGALVAFEDADFAGASLGPATIGTNTDTNKLVTVEYGTDGRPAGEYVVAWDASPITTDGNVTIGKDAEGNVVAFKMPLWLRTNVNGTVSMNYAAPTLKTGTGYSTGFDTTLIKMAVQLGTGNLTAATGTASGATTPTNTAVGAFVAGTAQQVTLYAYLDGPNVDNTDMGEFAGADFSKIEFTIDSIDGTASYEYTAPTP